MIIKALPALILVFFIWPLTLGVALGIKKNLDRFLIGFAAVQALFFLVYIPAICFAWNSRTLTYTAAIIITVVGVGGTLFRYYRAPSRKDFLALSKPNLAYFKNPFFLVAIGIILYEIWICVTKEPYIYGDDIVYLRMVTDFVDTNAIYTKTWSGQLVPTPLNEIDFKYVFTSYYPFLGMISILTKLHPLILCKTIIPLIYLPTHYLIAWRICIHLFDKESDEHGRIEKQSLFMFFYALLIEFGNISYYTISRRVTIWIYNSKSDCFTILLPILFIYTYLILSDEEERNGVIGNISNIKGLAIVLIMALACNSSTLMGVVLSPIVMVIWYLIVAFRHKKPSVFFVSLLTLIPHIITAILLVRFTGFTF